MPDNDNSHFTPFNPETTDETRQVTKSESETTRRQSEVHEIRETPTGRIEKTTSRTETIETKTTINETASSGAISPKVIENEPTDVTSSTSPPGRPFITATALMQGLPPQVKLAIVGAKQAGTQRASFYDADFILTEVERNDERCCWHVEFPTQSGPHRASLTATPNPDGTLALCAKLEGRVNGPVWHSPSVASLTDPLELTFDEGEGVTPSADTDWPRAVNVTPIFAAVPQQGHYISPEPLVAEMMLMAAGSSSSCAVNVSFDQNPVKTGFTVPVAASTLKSIVYATISPPHLAGEVSFEILPPTRATVTDMGEIAPGTGVVELHVKGTIKTGTGAGVTQTRLAAKHDGEVCSTVDVIVVIPEKIHAPYPQADGFPSAQNLVGDATTSPVWFVPGDPPLGPNQVGLGTAWIHWMTITVEDQFGDILHSVYSGVDIEELLGGNWTDINQDLAANGSYQDPVSHFRLPTPYVVARNGAAANAWPLPPPPAALAMLDFNMPHSISVKVGGHELSTGIVNRRVKATAATGRVQVIWPSP